MPPLRSNNVLALACVLAIGVGSELAPDAARAGQRATTPKPDELLKRFPIGTTPVTPIPIAPTAPEQPPVVTEPPAAVIQRSSDSTADFVVTPLVNPNTREFIASRSDFSRSFLLARIVIPLLLVLLIERELLIAGGRMGARAFLAYGLPLMAISALLAYARIRTYVD